MRCGSVGVVGVQGLALAAGLAAGLGVEADHEEEVFQRVFLALDVRVRVLGRFHELPASLQRELERDMALTREKVRLSAEADSRKTTCTRSEPSATLNPK